MGFIIFWGWEQEEVLEVWLGLQGLESPQGPGVGGPWGMGGG